MNKKPSKRRTSEQVFAGARGGGHRTRMTCGPCDKWAYLNRNDANDERRALRRKSKANGDNRPLDVYPCPENPAQWHIGHNHLRAEEVRLQYLRHGVS